MAGAYVGVHIFTDVACAYVGVRIFTDVETAMNNLLQQHGDAGRGFENALLAVYALRRTYASGHCHDVMGR